MKEIMTPREAAEYLSIHVRTIYRLAKMEKFLVGRWGKLEVQKDYLGRMALRQREYLTGKIGLESMREKILIVDDEKEIRSLLSKALTKHGGFQIDVAENGEEALKKIEKDQFDLVLTDLKMPKINGLELIRRVATNQPNTLTVLMTGHGSIDSAIEAMKQGASDYLTKPLNLDEMFIRLRKVLEERNRFISLKDYAVGIGDGQSRAQEA